MLFRVVDHYNIDLNEKNEKNKNNEKIECFICFETVIENELQPIRLNLNNYYIKKCSCDGFIHKKCLDIWYSNNKKCPICRKFMCDNTTVSVSLICKGRYILFSYIIKKKKL